MSCAGIEPLAIFVQARPGSGGATCACLKEDGYSECRTEDTITINYKGDTRFREVGDLLDLGP